MSIRALLPSIESLGVVVLALLASIGGGSEPSKLADTYVEAVKDVNDAHAKKPVPGDEAALSKKFPAAAVQALDGLLAIKGDEVVAALVRCGEAALDLDRMGDFDKVSARLRQLDPVEAVKLGIAISKPRYLMRGLDGVELDGLKAVSATLDEIFAAYDAVFGFAEWSKIPGKKLRVRVHLVAKITRPPHFAPQFPWHSEIDFPVVDAKGFSSPTPEGQFMLYGLCHELGHVVAMWGDTNNEEDKHQWAHYTGVTIVEYLSQKGNEQVMKNLRDVKWQSLALARKKLEEEKAKPGRADKNSVLALFIAVHDLVGARAIGDAINALDAENKRLRVNNVRYYGLDAFSKALLATDTGKKKAKELKAVFD